MTGPTIEDEPTDRLFRRNRPLPRDQLHLKDPSTRNLFTDTGMSECWMLWLISCIPNNLVDQLWTQGRLRRLPPERHRSPERRHPDRHR